jgi:putative SOS response-associated peptidase YedK
MSGGVEAMAYPLGADRDSRRLAGSSDAAASKSFQVSGGLPRLYAFLTTEPNAEVGAVHPKAMPVILTTPDEVETWMTAPPDDALKLQPPLPDGALKIVARGVKEDNSDSEPLPQGR